MDPRQFEYIENEIIIDKLFAFLLENNELLTDYVDDDEAEEKAKPAAKKTTKKPAAKKTTASSEEAKSDASDESDGENK